MLKFALVKMQISDAMRIASWAMSLAPIFVFLVRARAAARAYGPPDPMAQMPSSGSITSPLPDRRNVNFASATISSASKWRSERSVRQSFASSTAALIVEAAELLEPFQWLTAEQSLNLPEPKREAVRQEMADVLIYLVSLANCLDIDLLKAAEDKLAINAAKYPVHKAKGNASKYDELS